MSNYKLSSGMIFSDCAMHFFFPPHTNMLLFWQKLRKFVNNCQNMNFSQDRYFLNDFFFCHNKLFYWKSAKFAIFFAKCRNINFPCGWYFLNVLFFFFFIMNRLLLCRKSAKFASNCLNMNFARGWSSKYAIFFFLAMCCYIVESWQLIVKEWYFLWTDIF